MEIMAGVHVADNAKRLGIAALLELETAAGADVSVGHARGSVEDDAISAVDGKVRHFRDRAGAEIDGGQGVRPGCDSCALIEIAAQRRADGTRPARERR